MEKLYDGLFGLVEYLKEKIELYDKKLNKETYIKFNVERLETTPNSDYSSFQNSKLTFLEEEIWDNNDRKNFISEATKSYQDYNNIIYEIRQKLKILGLEENSPELYLERLLNKLLSSDKILSNEANAITSLLNDLEHNDLVYSSKLFLYGACLPENIDSFYLNEATIIRRTTKEDFEYKLPLNFYLGKENLHFMVVTKHRVPSIIIETKIKSAYDPDWALSKDEQALTMALRLLKPSRISIGFFEAEPNSIFKHKFIDDLSDPMYWRYNIFDMKNVIGIDELNKLKLILTEYYDILKMHLGFYIFNKSEEKNTSVEPLGVSLNFYREALLEDKYTEKQIASAVMGIEALLVKYEHKKKTQKFICRCQHLSNLFGIKFNDFKGVYNLRSEFVHGNGTNMSYTNKQTSSFETLNFLRLLLLLSLELKKNGLGKEDLINFLLDEQTNPKVSDAIKKIKFNYSSTQS